MNPQKIHAVETQISNKVIQEYEKEKKKSKDARFKFLKRKADKKGQEIEDKCQGYQKDDVKRAKMKENKTIVKRFQTILKGLENNHTTLKTLEEHEEL